MMTGTLQSKVHFMCPHPCQSGRRMVPVGVIVDAVNVATKIALLASIAVDDLVAAVVWVLASERASSRPCNRAILAALVAVLWTVRWALRDVVPAEGSHLQLVVQPPYRVSLFFAGQPVGSATLGSLGSPQSHSSPPVTIPSPQ